MNDFRPTKFVAYRGNPPLVLDFVEERLVHLINIEDDRTQRAHCQ